MTSNDLKRPRMISKESYPMDETVRTNMSTKNRLKSESLDKNLEVDDTYLDEITKTNSLDRLNGISSANYL